EGQVTYGLSGGPLLNLRTGGVCGIVQKTRSSKSDMGGRAIPTQSVLECFPGLTELQQQFHQNDQRWLERLSPQQLQMFRPASSPTIFIPENTGRKADPASQINIVEIAAFIGRRKSLRHSTVLFL